jgi:hypothetical protein
MNMKSRLVLMIETFAAAKGLSPSHVGATIFSSGIKYRQLVEGADVTTGRYEHAVRYLSTNWPDGVPWPADVPRPAVHVSPDLSAFSSSPEEVA